MKNLLFTTFLASLMALVPLQAEVRLPNVLSDHAVLQRDRPARIWGWAQPGETVEVRILGQRASAKADAKGHWEVFLQPEHAGGPFDLEVSGSSKLKLTDIMFGDVYMASGQSNMGMSFAGVNGFVMPHAAEVLAGAGDANLRLLMVPKETASTPQDDQPTRWSQSSPSSAAKFSLIGYLFGLGISNHEHVPVGIIEAAYGGTPAEAWVSAEGLAASRDLQPALAMWRSQIDSDTPSRDMPDSLRRAHATPPQPPAPGHHANNWAASALFNAMVAPVTPYIIRGVLWYQGEDSAEPFRAPFYASLLPALIADWRKDWIQPDLPFLIAQISVSQAPPRVSWGTIRDAERRTLSVANTALVVTYDLGISTNPHYPNKQPAADRFVFAARTLIYGEHVEASGPLFAGFANDGGRLHVRFSHGEGLHAGTPPGTSPQAEGTNQKLRGFEIAGADGQFVPAEASVVGDEVVLRSPAVSSPVSVRYAWPNYTDANLYNSVNLPAAAFTSAPPKAVLPPGPAQTISKELP